MTERDWEAAAVRRLERLVADSVKRVRDTADDIERQARLHLETAGKTERDHEWHTYHRVAAKMADRLAELTFNLKLSSLMDAAAEAESAWLEKRVAEKLAEGGQS